MNMDQKHLVDFKEYVSHGNYSAALALYKSDPHIATSVQSHLTTDIVSLEPRHGVVSKFRESIRAGKMEDGLKLFESNPTQVGRFLQAHYIEALDCIPDLLGKHDDEALVRFRAEYPEMIEDLNLFTALNSLVDRRPPKKYRDAFIRFIEKHGTK